MADALRGFLSGPGMPGIAGLCLGGPTTVDASGTFGRHLQFGAYRSDAEGSLNPPCIALDFQGFWRFRWLVGVGLRSITVYCKQAGNNATRPTMRLKANPGAGLANDVDATAASSTDWVWIGPQTFNCTAIGSIWVELHNNNTGLPDTCFFDRISVT